MKKIAVILLSFWCATLFAQTPSARIPTWSAYITPTAMLDLYGARIPVGLEYQPGNRWAYSLEASIPLKTYFLTPVNRERHKINFDLYLRAEAKHFLSTEHKNFVGLEFFWRNQELKGNNSSLQQVDDGYHRELNYRSADIFKNVFGLGVIIGTNRQIANQIFMQPYIGLGVRHNALHALNIEDEHVGNSHISYNFPTFNFLNFFEDQNARDREHTALYASWGLKLSVLLSRKRAE